MNLIAHPLTVAAELSWKQDFLGRANLAGQAARAGDTEHRWHLPRGRRRPARPRPTYRPRPA
jgi:hypothetical protein